MNNNMHKVKVKRTWETRICYQSSFSLEKYVSVWRGCGAQCSHEGQRGPPYSPHALTKQDVVIHYAVALKVAPGPLQYKVGAISTTQLEAPNKPRSFTTMECGSEVTSSV